MKIIRRTLIILVFCTVVVAITHGQQRGPSNTGGQQVRPSMVPPHLNRVTPVLPRVPRTEPRPGVDTNTPFPTRRSGQDRDPVAKFVGGWMGSDAVLELVAGQSRILTLKEPLAKAVKPGNATTVPVIAVADPTVIDFDVLPDQRMIRVTGRKVGVTDLTFVTSDRKTFTFEVHVVYDLPLITAHLQQIYPDALIRLRQLRDAVVLEGQARSTRQAARIHDTLRAYLTSIVIAQQGLQQMQGQGQQNTDEELGPVPGEGGRPGGAESVDNPQEQGQQPPPDAQDPSREMGGGGQQQQQQQQQLLLAPIINLLDVPNDQQVLLKVQIAELNRRAAREIGTNLTFTSDSGNFLQSIATGSTNLVGIFQTANFEILLNALRRNSVLTVLAEPNLVTLSGHPANFQSGGEFPVPVSNFGGGLGNNSVEFKEFGILLNFTPYIADTGVIRLQVSPEVSTVDDTLSVTLIEGGDAVPGVRTRNASTTVDLREGQTLAIAGLLNRDSSATTSRVPLLGDIPYFGTLFSETSHEVNEQELVVIVTPYLVGALDEEERIPLPGQEILEPNDCEVYLLGRIEGRTGRPFRSTTAWDHPVGSKLQYVLEKKYLFGPIGHSR